VSSAALACESLGVRAGNRWLVQRLSFELMPGEILAVLGPSGAGKSTLLRLLAGDLTPDEGRVFLASRDVTPEPLWRRARAGLGYVPQSPSVLFDLSVRRNIEVFMYACAQPGFAAEQAALLGLEHCLDTPARELSGGERRRLELLRAWIAQPKVLLCDEPFAGLDPPRIDCVATLLVRLRDQGGSAVLADHRVQEILELADRALLLLDGRLELIDTKNNFMKHPAVERRYVG
jgi:lipopolysaccharide export system ATP-binding protein